MLRVAAVTAALMGLSLPAVADFSGPYAPANWTAANVGANLFDVGAVNTTSAPASITLTGSNTDSAEFSRLDYTIVAPFTGTVSFDWSYLSSDPEGPGFDPAGRLLNGDTTQLSVDGDPAAQSGKASFNVVAGQIFGFYVLTIDNFGGSSTLTISNFAAPVPEPTSVAMMSLGLLGVAVVAGRRRRSN